MKRTVKQLLSALLAMLIVFSAVSPAVQVHAAQAEPEDYPYYTHLSTGDSLYTNDLTINTPEAIDDFLDIMEDLGIKRIQWRGLQIGYMTHYLNNRPEGAWRTLHDQTLGITAYYGESPFFDDEGNQISIDQYLVQEAHKRGMKVIGYHDIADWGAPGDATGERYPVSQYPDFLKEHPEWSPVDQWGLMKKGGYVELSYDEARQTLIDILMDEVKLVGYDGIEFMSYTENFDLRFDDQFGYNTPAVEEFKRRYGITPEMENLSNWTSLEHWRRLRGEYVTQFLRELKAELVEYKEDAIIAWDVNSTKIRQMNNWGGGNYDDSMVRENVYMDYETWVQEGLVDEFIVIGKTDFPQHCKVIDEMRWLCRGTDSEVVIRTSVTNLDSVNLPDYWAKYKAEGVPFQYTYGHVGEHEYYQYGPVITDKIAALDQSDPSWIRYHLYEVTTKQATASLDELKGYLDAEGVVIPRMAITAIVSLYPDAAAEVLEKMLSHDQPGVRTWAAQKIIAESRFMTENTVSIALEQIDRDHMIGTYSVWPSLMAKCDETKYWEIVKDPNTSLRMMVMAVEAMDPYVNTEEEIEYIHEHLVNGARYQVPLDQINSEDAYERLEAAYCNYIRWRAAREVGEGYSYTDKAKDYTLEYVLSDDTVVATGAIDRLGNDAPGYTDEYKEKALEVLDTVYGRLSPLDPYVYATDFKDWAYRPVGEALLKFGDEGRAVLETYYNGDDSTLALYAWRNIYMPQSSSEGTFMTYETYAKAYEYVPAALYSLSYKDIKLKQQFDKDPFNLAASGWVGESASEVGRWWFGPEIQVTNSISHTGNQSMKLTAGRTQEGWNQAGDDDGKNYELSLWVLPDGGTLTISTANLSMVDEVTVKIDADGKVWAHDATVGDFVDTGLTAAHRTWTEIKIHSKRVNGENEAVISVRPEGEAAASFQVDIAPKTGYMELKLIHTGEGASYVDDVLWRRNARDLGKIQLADTYVSYGKNYTVKAETNPSNLHVAYTYINAQGDVLNEAPTEVGEYIVNARVTDTGYSYAYTTAKLEILKATTIMTGEVTIEPLTFGLPLSECKLNTAGVTVTPAGEDTALTGTWSWDHPDLYLTADSQQGYTFTPDDPNYKPYHGTAKVDVVSSGYSDVPVFQQNFEAPTFTPETTGTLGDSASLGGKWYGLRQDGSLIVDLSTVISGATGQAIQLITTKSSDMLDALSAGVTGEQDFTLSMRIYRPDTDATPVISLMMSAVITVESDGSVILESVDTGLDIPVETWTTLYVTGKRDTGKVTVSIQKDGGDLETTEVEATLPAITFNHLRLTAPMDKHTGYVDDICLTTPMAETPEGYMVGVTPGGNKFLNETVELAFNLLSSDHSTYNAFRYELSYDADKLDYLDTLEGVNVDTSTPGKLIVTGSGVDRNINAPIKLRFITKNRGDAVVTLEKAYVDVAAVEDILTTQEDTITFGSMEMTISGFCVELDDALEGSTSVETGHDYTFAPKVPYYQYVVSATMGGVEATVITNTDGSYTIENVTGDLVITAQKTAKQFTADKQGGGKDDLALPTAAPTYATDYVFTLNEDSAYIYEIIVNVGGEIYEPVKDGNTYTIPGENVTGDVVITVSKTIIPPTFTQITFIGNGAADVVNGTSQSANNGTDFIFAIDKADCCEYTVTAAKGQANVTVTESATGAYVIAVSDLDSDGIYVMVTRGKPAHTPNADGNVCDVCDKVLPDSGKHINSSLVLKENLGVNFYLELGADLLTGTKDVKVQFQLPNGSKKDAALDMNRTYTMGSKTLYIFSCDVAAKEMASDIKGTLMVDGVAKTTFAYSVLDYANYVLENEGQVPDCTTALADLTRAMLNYGAMAQKYFNFQTGNLANAGCEDADLSGVTFTKPAGVSAAGEGIANKITFKASSLLLESKVTLRLYFKVEEGVTPTFTYGGKALTWIPVTNAGDAYNGYVEISDIAAKDLDKLVQVQVSDGASSATIQYSPIAYCYAVVSSSSTDANLKNLMRALYKYNAQAKAYFGN